MKEIIPEESNYRIVYLDIVHRCNMECANCYLPNRDFADLETDKILHFISRFKKPTEFRFIGGEPTLHKDLPYIIKQVNEMPIKHRTTVVTNGLRMASGEYVKQLKEAGLKTVYLSMTGFDDDEVYKITDNLACANKKIKALNNIINNKLRLALGCIVIKGLNEHAIDKIKNRLYNSDIRVGTSVEFRNVGQVGRYMRGKDANENYDFEDLKNVIFEKFNVKKPDLLEFDGYSYYLQLGKIRINITDWKTVNEGFNQQTNSIRGRLTPNWTVAPFLEHIKENDGGY
jgi:molybdenum cofactor biosynthesis enzyme MoaA